MSLEEINKGTCGGWDALVPPNVSRVPAGKRILEFTDTDMHKQGVATDNLMVYKPMFPSFQDTNKHPDGLCVPCCFTRPTTMGNSDWEFKQDEKGKDVIIIIKKPKQTSKKYPSKDIVYDDMYAPVGESKHGIGPEYDTDKNGNIIMESIKGEKMQRAAPPPSRKDYF